MGFGLGFQTLVTDLSTGYVNKLRNPRKHKGLLQM